MNGCSHIFMDNRYAAPQLLALMTTNYNICPVSTYKVNRIGFKVDGLKLEKNAERGSFKRLVDKRLRIIITPLTDSKTLQTVSTVMCKGAKTIQCRIMVQLSLR